MRKIGLYIQETAASGMREMIGRLRPSVVLLHLDGGMDFIGWLKGTLPGTFVIGRKYWTQEEQDSLLRASGADVARLVLSQKGAVMCDAFMLLNEAMGSPVDHGGEPAFRARAAKLDELQVSFRAALLAEGKEAVACNFAAGNWPTVSHYREHFPLTLGVYKYVGFHVYAWPKLTSRDWHSNLDETLRIVEALPDKTCIITEMAVTRAYAQPGHPDLGWLSDGDGGPLSIDDYAGDIARVNDELCKRPNVLGACLFNAAPNATWTSFAVTEELVARLEKLPECLPQKNAGNTEIKLRLPFEGNWRLTQAYGARPEVYVKFGLKKGHEGTDWGMPIGTPVLAVADGTVIRVDTVDLGDKAKDPYGLSVRLQHAGCVSVCAHLSRVDVVKGATVKAGDRIGLSGNSGNSEGPHLHLSIVPDGANVKDGMLGTVDPMKYMEAGKPVDPSPGSGQGPEPGKPGEEARKLISQAAVLLARAQEILGG